MRHNLQKYRRAVFSMCARQLGQGGTCPPPRPLEMFKMFCALVVNYSEDLCFNGDD